MKADTDRTVTIQHGESVLLEGIEPRRISDADRKSARGLLSVQKAGSGTLVKPAGPHKVGRARLGSTVVTVEPPLTLDAFGRLFLYANGRPITYQRSVVGEVGHVRNRSDFFAVALASSLITEAAAVLRTHVDQDYERRTERGQVIRGRPRWTNDMGRLSATGVTCTFFEKTTNTLQNRLVLAGVERARQLLRMEGVAAPSTEAQYFIWRSLAEPMHPRLEDFTAAHRSLTRMNEHYRVVLDLARLILFGFDPSNLFRNQGVEAPLISFNLSRLFHDFLHRLLTSALPGSEVRTDARKQRALVDGLGARYSSMAPDLVIWHQGVARAVLDAKFKPRYVEAAPGGKPLSRVSSADSYQILYYQSSTLHRHGLDRLPSAIIAPVITGVAATRSERLVAVDAAHYSKEVRDERGFSIIPVPLDAVLGAIQHGASAKAALEQAPALVRFLASVGE